MKNLKEGVLSVILIIAWLYLGWQNSVRFFYWVGFFSFPFIGFWIIKEITKLNEPENKNKSTYENIEELRDDLSKFTKDLGKYRFEKQKIRETTKQSKE